MDNWEAIENDELPTEKTWAIEKNNWPIDNNKCSVSNCNFW